MSEANDYAEPGRRDPLPRSPLIRFVAVALGVAVGLSPVWGLLVASLLGAFD